jgi:hypothetical protein
MRFQLIAFLVGVVRFTSVFAQGVSAFAQPVHPPSAYAAVSGSTLTREENLPAAYAFQFLVGSLKAAHDEGRDLNAGELDKYKLRAFEIERQLSKKLKEAQGDFSTPVALTLARDALDIASSTDIPGYSQTAGVIRDATSLVEHAVLSAKGTEWSIEARQDLTVIHSFLLDLSLSAAEDARALAQMHPEWAPLFDGVVQMRVNARVLDTDASVMQRHPEVFTAELLKVLQTQVDGAIGEGGTIDQHFSALASVIERSGKANASIYKLIEKMSADNDSVEKSRRELNNHQTDLAGMRSTVYLLSKTVGLKSPELGNNISAVGNTALDLSDALRVFAQRTQHNPEQFTATMAKVALCGDFVGAAVRLVGLLNQPDPDARVLEAIRQLSGQIEQQTQEMRVGLEALDQRIVEVYDGLSKQLQQIARDVGAARRDVAAIAGQVQSLERRVNETHLSILDAMGNLAQLQEFKAAVTLENWNRVTEPEDTLEPIPKPS